ncbi:MAG TPA: T9SS type A sorting domain-containing protein [Chitinophagaceae bacterium]|nr:T9SS type A sorting domain-containing protein [Chitinophagaceae bacterium]
MKKIFTWLLLSGVSISSLAQFEFNESFTDGNYTSSPPWGSYSLAHWTVTSHSDVAAGANNSNTLRLNNSSGAGVSYISAQISGSWGLAQEWGFFLGRRAQAYSGTNYTAIWLWANEPDLTSPTISGYRILIGDNSGDQNFFLQEITDNVVTNILVTTNGLAAGLTDFGFLLRVTRSNTGVWKIFTSTLPTANGTGAIATASPNSINANILQGTVTDNTHTSFNYGYIGFTCGYANTAAARTAQEFDQVRFSNTSELIMPVKLDKFEASKESSGVKLTWNSSDETGVKDYEVLRSDNGVQFVDIGTVTADQSRKYSYIDNQSSGSGFYRLRIRDFDGNYKLSHIVSVKAKSVIVIKTTPNPARGIVNIEHPKATSGASLQVTNAAGTVVRKLTIPENAVVSPVDFTSLQSGVYHVVYKAKDQNLTQMVIKQ